MLDATGMVEIVVVMMWTPNSAVLANAWILLNKKVVDLLNGKAITTAMMVKNLFVIFHNNKI